MSAEPEVLLHVPVIRPLVLLSIITIGVIVVVRLRCRRSDIEDIRNFAHAQDYS
eukprot:COSAG06_NODE_36107_length_451_cov_1.730114_1_plen_54_part_00